MNYRSLGLLLLFGMSAGIEAPAQRDDRSAPVQHDISTQGTNDARKLREQAYARLLEGQRYIWAITSSRRDRSPGTLAKNAALARASLREAIRLEPGLAEAYTALAELNISVPPSNIDDAIDQATNATRIDRNNFGAHRILARLMTYKSGLSSGKLVPGFTSRAMAEWTEVTRLDARNAEAWAFLSAFYNRQNKTEEEIVAVRQWLASSNALDSQFYQRTMGGRETLSAENASLKLGAALLKAGKAAESVEVLSALVADFPDSSDALESLREAVEISDRDIPDSAITALKQAVAINRTSYPLVALLARVQSRTNKHNEALDTLRTSLGKLDPKETEAISNLHVSIGDINLAVDRTDEAVRAYDMALSSRGQQTASGLTADDREFAMMIFEKIISAQKASDRPVAVLSAIERARGILGKDDLFADRQLISFYRETGRKKQALSAIRALRAKLPGDYGLIRLEASVLTDLGRVDEAVAALRKMMAPHRAAGSQLARPIGYDDFSNHLFISNLFSQANRGREAADAANEAYGVAVGEERKQIARLTLATAQQMSGDGKAAENTLREILAKSPGNPIALNNLGYFLLEQNERLDEAFGLIMRAYRVDPTNPSYLDSLGWAYFRLGKLPEAERYLKEASLLNPSSSTILEHLGDVSKKQGKLDVALRFWTKALQLASESGDTARLKSKLRQR